MKNCLDVGLHTCLDSYKGDSFVDEIPCINLLLVANLKSNDKQELSDVFERTKVAAYKRLISDLKIKMGEEKAFNDIIAETQPSSVAKNRMLSRAGQFIGYVTMMPYHRFTEYHVHSISMFAHKAGTVELHIIDLVTNQVIEVNKIEVVKGLNKAEINTVIDNESQKHLWIGLYIDTAVLETMECGDLTDCCECDFSCGCEIEYGSLQKCGVYNVEQLKSETEKYFCIEASMECNFEKMVCKYAKYFQEAYKYLVAIHLVDEKLNSYNRGFFADVNNQHLLDIEVPKLNEYYFRLLKQGIESIKGIMNDSICWSCSSNSTRPLLTSYV